MKPAAYGLESVGDVNLVAGDRLLGEPVTTPHEIAVDWSPQPPAATTVDVSDASMSIAPRAQEESLPAVNVSPGEAGTFVLGFPSGVRVRSLRLADLSIRVGDAIVSLASRADLRAQDPALRLTVSVPDPRGGFAPASYAVPAVSGRAGVTPSSLTGASFEGGVLSLPDVAASRLRIALVTGDPGDFSTAPGVSLSRVSAVTARFPTGLTLSDSGGATLWSFPKELPPGSAAQPIDFKPGLKKAVLEAVKSGAPPVVRLKLDAPSSAAMTIRGLRISGALVRAFPGPVRTAIEGSATPLALVKAGDPPLFVDETTTVTADVTVRYDGIRLVRELSDPVPAGASGGIIVGADAARAPLPPDVQVLRTHALARVGLVGRAPEACELSVRFVRPLTGEPLPGEPAVVRLDRANGFGVVWLTQKTPFLASGPVAVAVRATRGRFFWAADARGRPLIQIAVLDPNPPERTISLNGCTLVEDLTPAHRTGVALTASFRSGATPLFESALFATVDLSDVTFRYAR